MVSVADDSICIANGRRTWKNDQKGYDDPSVGSTKGHGIGNSVDAMKSAKSHKSRDELETSRERFRTLIKTDYEVWFAGVHCGMFLFYLLSHEGGWIQCSSLFMCRRWWRFRRQRHSALSFVSLFDGWSDNASFSKRVSSSLSIYPKTSVQAQIHYTLTSSCVLHSLIINPITHP